ncbi:MAG: hypothetical protein AAGA99_22410 [Actinomycetota bacterium]
MAELAAIAVAMISIVPGVLAARRSKEARRHAEAANNAVNNIGPDEPRLIERVQAIEETVDDMRTTLLTVLGRLLADDGAPDDDPDELVDHPAV